MMDEEIRQAVSEVREMKQMCGNINMKLTNIVTQRGQDIKKKLEAEYQRGLEDGKAQAERGCEGCQWEDRRSCEICETCCNKYQNQWQAKQADDEIKVGDEVIWDGEVIVVTSLYENGGFDWCDGIGIDGRAFHVLTENVRKKTGNRYDIASILKEMQS